MKIECLECERNAIRDELEDTKDELNKIKNEYDALVARLDAPLHSEIDVEELKQELQKSNQMLQQKNEMVKKLDSDLQMKTQNLQQLVNTELWSKNKEIAKFHNHITASQDNTNSQLSMLIKVLSEVGIQVKFANNIVQLNYVNGDKQFDVVSLADYIQQLIVQRNNLVEEDYLRFAEFENNFSESDCTIIIKRNKWYCELLRSHLKDIMRYFKGMLKQTDDND